MFVLIFILFLDLLPCLVEGLPLILPFSLFSGPFSSLLLDLHLTIVSFPCYVRVRVGKHHLRPRLTTLRVLLTYGSLLLRHKLGRLNLGVVQGPHGKLSDPQNERDEERDEHQQGEYNHLRVLGVVPLSEQVEELDRVAGESLVPGILNGP